MDPKKTTPPEQSKEALGESESWLKEAAVAPRHSLSVPPLASPDAETKSEDPGLAHTKPLEYNEGIASSAGIDEAAPQGGRYQIQKSLEVGGLGEVLVARDQRLDRPVAVKRLKRRSYGEARFLREALLTAKLEHPGIVPIHDLWQQNESPHYAMKLVEGRPLSAVLEEKKTLSERLSLLPQVINVCEAIAYAHSKKIIHRDLKPQNVMIGAFGEAIVIDWGLAKELGNGEWGIGNSEKAESGESGREKTPEGLAGQTSGPIPPTLTQEGAVMGTPAFMPPEQAQAKEVDERADVYALGAILYCVLSGAPPYLGKSAADICARVVSSPPIPLEDRQSGIPRPLLSIVEKAMARDSRDRYPSAKELAEDLKRFQAQQRVVAHVYSSWERFLLWAKRHQTAVRVGLSAVAALSLIVAVGVALLYSAWGKEGDARQLAERKQKEAESALARAQAAEKRALEEKENAERSLISLLTEQGRQELLNGQSDRAVAFLSEAYQHAEALGGADAALRFLLAGAMRPFDTKPIPLEGYPGEPSSGWFSQDRSRIIVLSEESTTKSSTLTLYDASSYRRLLSFPGPSALSFIMASQDASRILTTDESNTAKVWDATTGKLLSSLEMQYTFLRILTLSPDGSRIFAVENDFTTNIWDAATGKPLLPLVEMGAVESAHFSPESSRLALAFGYTGGYTVKILDVASGKVLASLNGHKGQISSLTFSPDGARLVTTSTDKTAKLWDAATGDLLSSMEGHDDRVTLAKFLRGGLSIITKSDDKTTKVWWASGRLLASFEGEPEALWGYVDAGDGRSVTVGEGGKMVVSEIVAGRMIFSVQGPHDFVSAKFSPDGGRILTAGYSQMAQIRDASSGKLLLSLDDPLVDESKASIVSGDVVMESGFKMKFATFSKDGKWVLTLDDDYRANLFDATSGKHLAMLTATEGEPKGRENFIDKVNLSPDGRLILTLNQDKTAKIWSNAGQLISSLDGFSDMAAARLDQFKNIIAAEFSPDSSRVAIIAEEEKTARIYEPLSGKLLFTLEGHLEKLLWIVFSPDGSRIATTSLDKTVKIWDTATGKSLLSLEGHSIYANRAKFFPDGSRLLTTSEDDTAKIWDVLTGKLLASFPIYPYGPLALSPDGRRIVVASDQNTAKLWDEAGHLLASLEGHNGEIYSIELSPDSNLIATTSADQKIRIWDAASGKLLAVLEGHTYGIRSMEFSPDGARLVTAAYDGTVKLWDLRLESRDAREIAAFVKEQISFELKDGRLVPTH